MANLDKAVEIELAEALSLFGQDCELLAAILSMIPYDRESHKLLQAGGDVHPYHCC